MRTKLVHFLGIFTCLSVAIGADAPAVKLDLVDSAAKTVPLFNEAQLAAVQTWIRQKAPECPADAAAKAAEAFLGELQEREPQKLDEIVAPSFPVREFESMLFRHIGAQLTSPAYAPLREQIARRRIQAVLAGESGAAIVLPTAVDPLLAKIKEMSAMQYRRLLEGRIEDDDLALLLRKAKLDDGAASMPAPKTVTPPKPRVLTASDIVSEFSRRNQVGSAVQKLRAYTVEGRLKTATGEEQQLLLFRMRPDRFRLVVRSAGATHLILGFDGERYWEQSAGRPPAFLKESAVGTRRFLGEFVDPLFAEEGTGSSFERLEDGANGEKKFYRIQVRRADGSTFVARVDPDSFHEIGRENEDKTTTAYTDFREIAGVTMAFHEEVTDASGRKGTLDVTRVSANPGLIQAFFEASPLREMDYFSLERALAQSGGAETR